MNKTQKTQKCREILSKYQIGCKVTEFEDIEFLISIFEGHSEWELKQGSGIDSISIINGLYGTRCFQIHRTDGSFTDISFTHCITKKSRLSYIKDACRSAIRGEIINFKRSSVVFGGSRCPFTDEILTQENTHIDHFDLDFNTLFEKWMLACNFSEDSLYSNINETKDNSFITCFKDKEISDSFIEFHNKNTTLRAVSKKANLSILKSKTI